MKAAVLALALTIGFSGGAPAQGPAYDYCVACSGPTAIYLCTVGPREPDPGAAAWASYCAERVRSDMGHGTCSARSLGQDCRATRAFVFRGAQATSRQAEALVSPVAEERSSAAAEIWSQTLANMREVGDTVGESAEAVGDAAQSMSDEVWSGLKALGRTMSEGADCVVSMGDRC